MEAQGYFIAEKIFMQDNQSAMKMKIDTLTFDIFLLKIEL